MMACHTVHYDTTVLGRLVSPLRGCRIMMPSGLRRSTRDKAAKERAMKESTEDAARDIYAEDAVEDSDGPGPDRGRAHGSSGVHKDPDKVSSGSQPSTPVGTRGSGSADRPILSGHAFGDGRRSSPPGVTLNTTGNAPSKHAIPLGNTTSSSSPLGDASRGGPHTASSDGEPNGTRSKLVHPARASAEAEYHPIPAMEATSTYDLGPEKAASACSGHATTR